MSRHGAHDITLALDAQHRLKNHSWPGNVRELDNVIQRALILCDSKQITSQDLIIEQFDDFVLQDLDSDQDIIQSEALGCELKQQENQIILDTLVLCNGSRKDVAVKLGISPRTLRYKLAKMRDMGIELPA